MELRLHLRDLTPDNCPTAVTMKELRRAIEDFEAEAEEKKAIEINRMKDAQTASTPAPTPSDAATPITDANEKSADRFGDRDVVTASLARTLERELAEATRATAEKDKLIAELREEKDASYVSALERDIERSLSTLASRDSEVERLKGGRKRLTQVIEDEDARRVAAEERVNMAEATLASVRAERDALQIKYNSVENLIGSIENENDRLRAQIHDLCHDKSIDAARAALTGEAKP